MTSPPDLARRRLCSTFMKPPDAAQCRPMPPDAAQCRPMPPDAAQCRPMSPALMPYPLPIAHSLNRPQVILPLSQIAD